MNADIEDIIQTVLAGEELTAEEQKQFDKWYELPAHQVYFYQLQRIKNAVGTNKANAINIASAWDSIHHRLRPRHHLRTWLSYAAIFLLPLCAGISFYLLSSKDLSSPTVAENKIITPGRKQAILTLSDGREIPLGEQQISEVIREKGAIIHNNQENQLEYTAQMNEKEQVYNTIRVPRGGEYKLTLADGTIVWINSDSQLTYPVSFNGKSREIRLFGEAFFEVEKDSLRPFIVHTSNFNIRVTGTRFNVRSYLEEPESATLAEGSIQWENKKEVLKLIPGQQVLYIDGFTQIHNIDLEEAIAWRYEAFCFNQRKLENILNELARWYDIDVFYQNPEVKELHFTAWFRRSSAITEVLEILEKTNKIKLQLKGKTLTVANR